MKSVKELRIELIRKLKEKNIESPEISLGLIIMYVLNINKTELLIGDREVNPDEEDKIREYTDRLLKGEPIQYIVGFCEFMSLEFSVTPDVLIPRSDTEVLVESVMERLDKNDKLSVVDIGCGSGAIGISLAYYMNNLFVTAIDISEGALAVAEGNAKKIGVSGRVHFVKMDIMNEFPDTGFDCIVSNPPYIRTEVVSELDAKVREYEPLSALDGGEDGLGFYRRIALAPMLKKGGLLAFEIGYDQGTEVERILKSNGFTDVEILPDIEGRGRVVLGIKE